jgi:hypothetical protein
MLIYMVWYYLPQKTHQEEANRPTIWGLALRRDQM